ncbi:MAG: YdcF family protein, partial [Actinomyces sp.]
MLRRLLGIPRRWVFGIVVLGVVVTAYVAVTFVQVLLGADADELRSADAIVVLGAAQYDGTPSPVLARRLDHALELYRAGVAPLIVTTGSNQPGDRFTEGYAGYVHLLEAGVPDEDLLVITTGASTYEQLAATARELAA